MTELERELISIAFAGSSPPRPLRHVAAGLDGGRPGEGKDIRELGDWQDNLADCDSWLTLTVLAVAAVAFVVAVVVLPTPVPIAFSVPAASVDPAAPVAHDASAARGGLHLLTHSGM